MDKETFIKWNKMVELYGEVAFNYPEFTFFDFESEEMLDEKIEVLTLLKEGKSIGEIPNFYDILENLPKNDMWDV